MMRKILVIAPNWIGDALMAQPLFAQLKARHPRAQIHAVAPVSYTHLRAHETS